MTLLLWAFMFVSTAVYIAALYAFGCILKHFKKPEKK